MPQGAQFDAASVKFDAPGLVFDVTQVYNPQTMEDEILMVSGMPQRIGNSHLCASQDWS